MVADHDFTDDRDRFAEMFAARLTEAAYPIVLQHGIGQRWLELQLELWKAMTELVTRLRPEIVKAIDDRQHPGAV